MTFKRLLVANRGEVAVRVLRTAAEMSLPTVAVYSEDDDASLHVRRSDQAYALRGSGPAAYLDIEQVVEAALATGCDAVHPGWGFLAENANFAARCAEAGLTFVGPSPATLAELGDKVRARLAAAEHGVPILRGSAGPVTQEEAAAFFTSLGEGASVVIKAVAGGGGRGMRVVNAAADIPSLYARCQSEAERAFGDGSLYVEERMAHARHIEVQVVGDGTGAAVHLWERDCTIQRRHQKVVEMAPSPVLHPGLRARLCADAVRIAAALHYHGLGTFEFLVDATTAHEPDGRSAFIEANPRLQVEHTVTEEVLGLDLVRIQLEIAAGATLADLGLAQDSIPAPSGFAMQLRVNAESLGEDGSVLPSSGSLALFEPPSGPGIRVDTHAFTGFTAGGAFDSLLAKVIVRSPAASFDDLLARAGRALRETRIEGLATNVAFLQNLLEHPAFRTGQVTTLFVDEHLAGLVAPREDSPAAVPAAPISGHTLGARIDAADPLAVLTYGKQAATVTSRRRAQAKAAPASPGAVVSPMQGTVVSIDVELGEAVVPGQEIAVLNAMKMEHVLKAPVAGIVRRILAAPGDTVVGDQLLVDIEESDVAHGGESSTGDIDPDYIRPDLAEVNRRHHLTLDEGRPDAVAKRHKSGHRTVRENIAHLCDEGTFLEYGSLVLAAQRARRSVEELIEKSPADGLVMGIGSVNGDRFEDPAARCAVVSYDYTVFAGTQGGQNHRKTDRMIDLIEDGRLPLILFAEGGGGRPGDTEGYGGGGGSTRTFARFAQLSGLVPMVGITTGRCFAGNASLLGCCDVIIATEDSTIGMGGPAMIEGGGLGIFAPEEIGPMDVQVPNGVVDIAVADEAEAVEVAKKYISYFQGPVRDWEAPDQRTLRHVIPENRLRVYDVRQVIETMADKDSVLEIRAEFGIGMITSFVRIEGRPVGVVANNPMHLGGAIDSDGSDKAARFMQLCDAFGIPILLLCDTPGIMVGPEIEKTALVRHSSRLFLIGANLSVPMMTIVLRKAYGLGAIAMAGGSFKTPYFAVSWPTGEFGGMGLEGSVKLGYRNELLAIEDPEERRQKYEAMVARAYERGKALSEASYFGVDDTIDPADSRWWVATLLKSIRPPAPRDGKRRSAVDAW